MIDLEIFILLCLIIILIYNYHSNDCYTYFKRNKKNKYNKHQRCQNPKIYQYDDYYLSSEFKNNDSNVKYPQIELEGFINNTSLPSSNINNDPQKLPDNVLLNDRYNDYITPYTDDELTNLLVNYPLDTNSDYSQSLINDLQKNIIFDIDTKITNKTKQTQKLAKDSATIASQFGRNSLLESYKNELDEYEKERTPWWAESN